MFNSTETMDEERLGLTILKVIGSVLLFWGGHHMGSSFFSYRDQEAQVARHFDASGAVIERVFFGADPASNGVGERKTWVTIRNGTSAAITYVKGRCEVPAGIQTRNNDSVLTFDAEQLGRVRAGETATVAVKTKTDKSGSFFNSADLAKYRCTSVSDFDIKDQTKAIGYKTP